ncbi:MAG: DUF2336 domain-containing protein [Rhizobiaceae bacterium]
MAWSVVSGADQRADAISRLAVKFLNGRIPAEEQSEIEKALTLYTDDVSPKVRIALARVLARSDNAPRHLIWALSQDIAEVSTIIYSRSSVLGSRDLINAISNGKTAIQQAIASRETLDGDTIRALVRDAGGAAILDLLHNPQVVLGPGLKHDIAQRMGDRPEIRATLLNDDMIDPATRQLLCERLSTSLLDFSSNMGWSDGDRLQKVANDARNRVTVEIAMKSAPHQMGGYVDHLQQSGQLSAALLLRASCMGHAALFECALSKLSGTSLRRVQAIIDEGRVSAFNSLYGRTGLPKSAYPVFVAAIEAWQQPKDMPELIDQILDRAQAHEEVDGSLLAMLAQMSCEAKREAAQNHEKQVLLAA